MLKEFYGPFKKNLEDVQDKIKKVKLKEEVTDSICEFCGRNMVIKQGKYGKFLACPGYPECKNAKPIVEEINEKCPRCGGKIIVKKTKTRRSFYVCENNTNDENKTCDYISWTKPSQEEKKKVTRKTTKKKNITKKKTATKKSK